MASDIRSYLQPLMHFLRLYFPGSRYRRWSRMYRNRSYRFMEHTSGYSSIIYVFPQHCVFSTIRNIPIGLFLRTRYVGGSGTMFLTYQSPNSCNGLHPPCFYGSLIPYPLLTSHGLLSPLRVRVCYVGFWAGEIIILGTYNYLPSLRVMRDSEGAFSRFLAL